MSDKDSLSLFFIYSQTSIIRPHWFLDNLGGLKNSRINQKLLYIYLTITPPPFNCKMANLVSLFVQEPNGAD